VVRLDLLRDVGDRVRIDLIVRGLVVAAAAIVLAVVFERITRNEHADCAQQGDVRDADNAAGEAQVLEVEHPDSADLDADRRSDDHQPAEFVIDLSQVVVFQRRYHGRPEDERHPAPDGDSGGVSHHE